MSDIADAVKQIVVEHLGIEESKVTPEAKFIDDLGGEYRRFCSDCRVVAGRDSSLHGVRGGQRLVPSSAPLRAGDC